MKTLEGLRNELDSVDDDILCLLKRRIEIVERVGKDKNKFGKKVRDLKREREVIGRLTKIGRKYNIDQNVIKKIWIELFKLSYKLEGKTE